MGGFDSQIAAQEFRSSVGYWILVLGLIGDILVLTIPKHRERLEKVLAAFFTIVIIVGVAVEHRADAAISVFVSQEQTLTARQVADAQLAARSANAIAQSARAQAEGFRLQIAQANERASRAEEKAAVANRGLVKERNMRSMMQFLGYPRRVFDARSLTEALRQFKGTRINLESYSDDNEGLNVCRQIRDSLNATGLKVLDMCATLTAAPRRLAFTGIGVWGPTSERDTAESLGSAISRIGRLGVVSGEGEPENTPIVIFVGHKPEAYVAPE